VHLASPAHGASVRRSRARKLPEVAATSISASSCSPQTSASNPGDCAISGYSTAPRRAIRRAITADRKLVQLLSRVQGPELPACTCSPTRAAPSRVELLDRS
jgi:hypothetical protein